MSMPPHNSSKFTAKQQRAGESLIPKATSNHMSSNFSGSETDVSTSTENLSQEERYVIKNMPRQEPQGQEKQETNDNSPYSLGLNSLDNASSYNTLIIHATGEDVSEPWSAYTSSRLSSLRDSYVSATSSHSKATSVPSSSPSSSPTLSGVVPPATLSGSPSNNLSPLHLKQQLRDITDIPDDYLSESRVLKHLAKEVKVVPRDSLGKNYDENVMTRRLLLLDLTPSVHSRIVSHRYSTPLAQSATLQQCKLMQSRSQPDLSQLDETITETGTISDLQQPKTQSREVETQAEIIWPASDLIQLLIKENSSLKNELDACYKKVSKSQKLELEVTNIHKSHQELMQSSERREKLERAARQKLQDENRALRHQYDLLLSQLESSSTSSNPVISCGSSSNEMILQLRQEIAHRDSLLTQLMSQNKDLTGCRERQEIELAAQRATLQEQRTHIDILDAALNNAQSNVVRLEEECRKRQLYEERVVQLQQSLSSLQLAREQLEGEINDLRVSRRGNSQVSQLNKSKSPHHIEEGDKEESADLIQKLRDKDNQLLSLEREVARWQQWYMDDNALRQAVIDAASIPLDAKIAALEKTSQESERLMAEARSDKIRQLDELHAAQRKIADLESRAQELESRLAEKEAMIKVLQVAHQHHHSNLIPTSSSSSNPPPLSGSSPHHHSYSTSSFYRQPSPSSIGGTISNSSMLGSLGPTPGNMIQTSLTSTPSVSSPTYRSGLNRNLTNLRTTNSGLSFSHKTDYGSSSSAGPASTISSCSTSPLIVGQREENMLDDQLQNIDSQLLSGRVLCCFSGFNNRGLTTRKEGISQPLLVGLRHSPLNEPVQNLSQTASKQQQMQNYKEHVELQETGSIKSERKSTNPQSVHRNSPKPYNVSQMTRSGSSGSGRQSTCSSLPPTPSPVAKEKKTNTNYFSYGSTSSKSPVPSSPVHKNTNSDILPGNYGSSNMSTTDEGDDALYKKNSAFSLHPSPSRSTSGDHGDRYMKSSSCYENSKTNEILLLEKQGRSSQKQRRSSAGSQGSADDTKPPLCLSSSLARPKTNISSKLETRKTFRRTQTGYNRLEESISTENVNDINSDHKLSSSSKFSASRELQSSRKSSPEKMSALNKKVPSYEKLGSGGVKYRIHL